MDVAVIFFTTTKKCVGNRVGEREKVSEWMMWLEQQILYGCSKSMKCSQTTEREWRENEKKNSKSNFEKALRVGKLFSVFFFLSLRFAESWNFLPFSFSFSLAYGLRARKHLHTARKLWMVLTKQKYKTVGKIEYVRLPRHNWQVKCTHRRLDENFSERSTFHRKHGSHEYSIRK